MIDLRKNGIVNSSAECPAVQAAVWGCDQHAIGWIKRVDETGSVAPSQMSGHQAKGCFAGLCNLVVAPDQGDDFTVHGLVAELAGRPKDRPST